MTELTLALPAQKRQRGGDYDLLLHNIIMFQLSVTLIEGGNVNSNWKRYISASYAAEEKGRLSALMG